MLIELLISLTFLTVAVGALLAVFVSSASSLRHVSIEGNALALADKQMETFKTVAFPSIAIDTTTLPPSSDVYVTSPASNLTSSQQAAITSGQRSGGITPATQTVTGPDNRTYRIDSYVYDNPTGSGYEQYVQATVAVRSVIGGTVGPVRAQVTSAFNQASTRPPPA